MVALTEQNIPIAQKYQYLWYLYDISNILLGGTNANTEGEAIEKFKKDYPDTTPTRADCMFNKAPMTKSMTA